MLEAELEKDDVQLGSGYSVFSKPFKMQVARNTEDKKTNRGQRYMEIGSKPVPILIIR